MRQWIVGVGLALCGAAGAEEKHLTNIPVHQWVGNEGYRYFAGEIEGADIGPFVGEVQPLYLDSFDNFLEGTWAQDENSKPPLNESFWPFAPYVNHLCAGADGEELFEGWGGQRSNFEQAQFIWEYTVAEYPQDRARAFYYLGQVAHLLADVCVPAHTHNDAHWPLDPDHYEVGMGVANVPQRWHYGGGRSGNWTLPLTLHPSLETLFRTTTNYSEDYASSSRDGDDPPYFFPADYPTTWHRPQDVRRGWLGLSDAEVCIVADDMMPYAIRRTAELLRIFYLAVDESGPLVTLLYPQSDAEALPATRSGTGPFYLRAAGEDAESGVVRRGYVFEWGYRDGEVWSDWTGVRAQAGSGQVSFSPTRGAGLYRFRVRAENGGGRMTLSRVHFLRIEQGPDGPAELLTPDEVRWELLESFEDADADSSGSISAEEAVLGLELRGAAGISTADFQEVDADEDGALTQMELRGMEELAAEGGCLDVPNGCGFGGKGDWLILGIGFAVLGMLGRRSL